MNTQFYPKKNFVKVSTDEPIDSFLYKTHSFIPGVELIKVKNTNVSSGLLNFYDLRIGDTQGLHAGYYIETPYAITNACNFLLLKRKNDKPADSPQLSFKLPGLCIYTLGSGIMILVSDTTGSSLIDALMVP